MRKFIRDKSPFIMLGYSFVFTFLYYLVDYKYLENIYPYLSQVLGYSFFTSIFMLSVYFNKRYCDLTKLAVVCLIFLNLVNIIYYLFNCSYWLYDVIIWLIVVFVLLYYKKKKYV